MHNILILCEYIKWMNTCNAFSAHINVTSAQFAFQIDIAQFKVTSLSSCDSKRSHVFTRDPELFQNTALQGEVPACNVFPRNSTLSHNIP